MRRVKVNAVDNRDYLSLRRGDALTSGKLSVAARTSLQVAGVAEKDCSENPSACREQVRLNAGLGEEQRLSTLSELWLQEAQDSRNPLSAEGRTDAFLESARYAYAYLFLTTRTPSQRALEDRQSQVRDYYNFSVQQALSELFERYRGRPPQAEDDRGNFRLRAGRWTVFGRMENVRLANERFLPQELIPAASISFAGLRNQYRRDGLGAELVAVTAKKVVNSDSDEQSWSETPFPAVTAVARFPGQTVEQVLATDEVEVLAYDPYHQDAVTLGGIETPLAANFTSGYGLWLARSGFARQSLLTLGEVLKKPHLYLLQPYDPERHVVIMLHGLASSPEAWINVANEVLGDEHLRRNYQVWQLYYPTNLPLALNNATIRSVIEETLQHFDPEGTARASHDVVLVGHSMGGVLSRLMVSTSGAGVRDTLLAKYKLNDRQLAAAHKNLDPFLRFSPLPQVSRAIFVAAPHQGTPFAENRISRWAAGLVQLPVSVLERFKQLGQLLVMPGSASSAAMLRPLNSIDNLSNRDPFVMAVGRSAYLPQGAVSQHYR